MDGVFWVLAVLSALIGVGAFWYSNVTSSPTSFFAGIGLFILAFLFFLGQDAAYFVPPTEVTLRISGIDGSTTVQGGDDASGWYYKVPFLDTVEPFSLLQQKISFREASGNGIELSDSDGQQTIVNFDVVFRIDPATVQNLYLTFKTQEKAIEHVVSTFETVAVVEFQKLSINTEEFFSGEGNGSYNKIQEAFKTALDSRLARYGFRDIAVNIIGRPNFPDSFEARVQMTNEQQQQILLNEQEAQANLVASQGQTAVEVEQAERNAAITRIHTEAEVSRLIAIAEAEAEALRVQIEPFGSVQAFIQYHGIEALGNANLIMTGDGVVPVLQVGLPDGSSEIIPVSTPEIPNPDVTTVEPTAPAAP